MKILVTGKNGQLGSEFQDIISIYPKYQFIFLDRSVLDLSDLNRINTVLDEVNPDVIINTAAYTAVDKAETEIVLCDTINHKAIDVIAKWAFLNKAKVIHVSTDYVFDGTSKKPLTETDTTDPINVYGLTKLRGEQALTASGCQYVIIRTSWVYSTYGTNFVKTMLRLMVQRDEIGVVSDQIGTPTYARDLAIVIMTIVEASEFISGIYHYSNEGEISWYDFATAIKECKGLSTKVNAISSLAFQTPAKRPNYSLLDKSKIKKIYCVNIPNWKDSLKEMLTKL